MSKSGKERKVVITMAMDDLEEVSVPIVSKMVMEVSDNKYIYKHVKCAVYAEINKRVKEGRLFCISGTYPPKYVKDAVTAANKKCDKKIIKTITRNTSNNPLIGKSVNEVISFLSGYLTNYELRPEAVVAYQVKIAELTEEILKIKNEYAEHKTHMKIEYDKLNTKIKSITALIS